MADAQHAVSAALGGRLMASDEVGATPVAAAGESRPAAHSEAFANVYEWLDDGQLVGCLSRDRTWAEEAACVAAEVLGVRRIGLWRIVPKLSGATTQAVVRDSDTLAVSPSLYAADLLTAVKLWWEEK